MKLSLQEFEEKIKSARSAFLHSVKHWAKDTSGSHWQGVSEGSAQQALNFMLTEWISVIEVNDKGINKEALADLSPGFIRKDVPVDRSDGWRYQRYYYDVKDAEEKSILSTKLCHLTTIFELLFELEQVFTLKPLTMNWSNLQKTLTTVNHLNIELSDPLVSTESLADYRQRHQMAVDQLQREVLRNAEFLEQCKNAMSARYVVLVAVFDDLQIAMGCADACEKDDRNWAQRIFTCPWDELFLTLSNNYLFGKDTAVRNANREFSIDMTVPAAYRRLYETYHNDVLSKLSAENERFIAVIRGELDSALLTLHSLERKLKASAESVCSRDGFFGMSNAAFQSRGIKELEGQPSSSCSTL